MAKEIEKENGYFSMIDIVRLIGEDKKVMTRYRIIKLFQSFYTKKYIEQLSRGKYILSASALSLIRKVERERRKIVMTINTKS